MTDSLSVIFDNRDNQACRLSILIPVRNDRRLFHLLDELKLQITDETHVYVLNDLKPEPLILALPAPIRGVILHSRDDLTIAGKVNALIAQARGDWMVIIESDTIPHKAWVAEMLKLTANADRNSIHQGGELFAKRRNLNNILFQRDLNIPPYEDTLYCAQDTAWFMACERAGIPIVRHDLEALIFHDARIMEGDTRFIKFAHDFAFIAAQKGQSGTLKRRLLAEGYYLVRGAINIILIPLFFIYFVFQRTFNRSD